jgi:hypothetical protein
MPAGCTKYAGWHKAGALVKGFVTLHRGGVQALSAGPGRGSEFIVRLPLNHEFVAQNETNVDDNYSLRRLSHPHQPLQIKPGNQRFTDFIYCR